jgi:hypothetical protein
MRLRKAPAAQGEGHSVGPTWRCSQVLIEASQGRTGRLACCLLHDYSGNWETLVDGGVRTLAAASRWVCTERRLSSVLSILCRGRNQVLMMLLPHAQPLEGGEGIDWC